MYMMDPDRGNRRRALVTDKLHRLAAHTDDAIDVVSRDLGNRVQGLRAKANRLLSRDKLAADNRVLKERVRQKLGHVVSHAHAIDAAAHEGCVTLSGPVLAHEKQALLDAVLGVPGVREVEDRLQVYESAEGISSLQGAGKPLSSSAARESWPPALRAIATVGGSALGIAGLIRRTPAGRAMAAAGLVIAIRGIVNMPLARMTGLRADGQTISLNKTIHIAAPPDKVFDLWNKYENFPHFMSHVEEVSDLGNGRSHWVVRGPAGARVEWTAVITESRRPEVLAWESEPDAIVLNTGRIRFEPEGNGTRVTVHMSYSPPAGVIGHAVASFLHGDPKQEMDDDLMRMKTFIETGTPPRDAAQPVREATAMQH
jgi:uncharacterized membrane protein